MKHESHDKKEEFNEPCKTCPKKTKCISKSFVLLDNTKKPCEVHGYVEMQEATEVRHTYSNVTLQKLHEPVYISVYRHDWMQFYKIVYVTIVMDENGKQEWTYVCDDLLRIKELSGNATVYTEEEMKKPSTQASILHEFMAAYEDPYGESRKKNGYALNLFKSYLDSWGIECSIPNEDAAMHGWNEWSYKDALKQEVTP